MTLNGMLAFRNTYELRRERAQKNNQNLQQFLKRDVLTTVEEKVIAAELTNVYHGVNHKALRTRGDYNATRFLRDLCDICDTINLCDYGGAHDAIVVRLLLSLFTYWMFACSHIRMLSVDY